MSDQLSGRKVAILAADGVERVELGASTELLSIRDREIAARNHDLDDAGTFPVLRDAGAEVVDEEVVTDEGLVSSRSPDSPQPS